MTKAKYKVGEILEALPKNKYPTVKKELEKALGVHPVTLSKMLNYKIDNKKNDWKGSQLFIAAQILKVKVDKLYPTYEEQAA